jgi:hypothetical protein
MPPTPRTSPPAAAALLLRQRLIALFAAALLLLNFPIAGLWWGRGGLGSALALLVLWIGIVAALALLMESRVSAADETPVEAD